LDYRNLRLWRTAAGSHPECIQTDFDDSSWELFSPPNGWRRSAGERWFRKKIVVPKSIYGLGLTGSRLDARFSLLAGVEIFINGEKVDSAGYWFNGFYTLSKSVSPGDTFVVAIRSPAAKTDGHFGLAQIYFDKLEDAILRIGIVGSKSALLRELSQANLIALDEKEQKALSAEPAFSPSSVPPIADILSVVNSYEEKVGKASEKLAGLTTFLVGHAHIDMNWMWPWEDTLETCRRTFRSVDTLMDEFPGFIFSQSQAAIYHAMEENDPEIFDMMRRRVRQGRLDVTASTWVEGDLNMACGESLVRQTTVALNYIQDRLGVRPRVCWCPDTFGHPWTYPQILKKCGVEFYYAHRCPKQEEEHLFWWEAPDGSRVLAFNEGVTYNNKVTPDLVLSLPKMLKHFDVSAHLVVFGVGDHGGGPTRQDLRAAEKLNRESSYPCFRHSRAEDFFEAIMHSDKIPVVRDELNFVFQGCYTTHSDIKRMNRRGEASLFATEVLASLAATTGWHYPVQELEKAWQNVLFNQFHDLLDGSAIAAAYQHSRKLYEEAMEICSRVSSQAESALFERAERAGGGRIFSVFNPLGWARSAVIRLKVQGASSPSVEELSTGATLETQVEKGEVVFVASLPPVGYSTYRLASRPNEENTGQGKAGEGENPPGECILENEFFRVCIDRESGTLISLFDKRIQRELIHPERRGNVFQVLYEKPHGMSAWNIGPISRTEDLLSGASVSLEANGPVFSRVHVERGFRSSRISQDILVYKRVPRIDFVTTIDWQETGGRDVDAPMLKVAFNWNFSSDRIVREIPFGHIESPTDGSEVPSQTFLEFPGDGFGVALLNDAKYGHDASPDSLRLTLLRSAYEPDPEPDKGLHRFTYSLLPHSGDWVESEVWKRGHELNVPPRVIQGGREPRTHSWIRIESRGIDMPALKKADHSEALVLRLVEMEGRRKSFKVAFGWPVSQIQKCDLTERPTGATVDVVKGEAMLELGPYEVGTYLAT